MCFFSYLWPDSQYTLFYIRTSNFRAEAERYCIVLGFEAENFLDGTQSFNKSKLRKYKVNYIDNTRDFVSPDGFDDVDIILNSYN